ncbi:MAG: cytochrome c-type biogenesis protein [Shewanella sp.]
MPSIYRSPQLRLLMLILILFIGLSSTHWVMAQDAATDRATAALLHQQQAIEISKILRCPMATNQSLFESQAPIAHELKAQIFTLLDEGKSQQDIVDFMVQRYGEKIRYQPEFKPATLVLWLGPLLLLVLGVGICLASIARKSTSSH